ncbi:MaoC/PaaZ C-terminal domain-containing protein [Salsuginibacillus kocurii]|uniref:MaoC/PaaZ C-terminal domain-containing protein n=1 Tax=Salsuginibacillus kocurii TaxID=427078 RepID=UPI00037FEA9A|nr:MaoC/PaaZ C-terminal domain-containing protein [Salsuginibacillus kocurii]
MTEQLIPAEGSYMIEPFSMEQVREYAYASGDLNKIHIDPETAKAHGLPGVIVHGLLTMGYMYRPFLSLLKSGYFIQSFQTKFLAKVYLNEALTIQWKKLEKALPLTYQVNVVKKDGTVVTEGEVVFTTFQSGEEFHE